MFEYACWNIKRSLRSMLGYTLGGNKTCQLFKNALSSQNFFEFSCLHYGNVCQLKSPITSNNMNKNCFSKIYKKTERTTFPEIWNSFHKANTQSVKLYIPSVRLLRYEKYLWKLKLFQLLNIMIPSQNHPTQLFSKQNSSDQNRNE